MFFSKFFSDEPEETEGKKEDNIDLSMRESVAVIHPPVFTTKGLFDLNDLVNKQNITGQELSTAFPRAVVTLALSVLRPMYILTQEKDYPSEELLKIEDLVTALQPRYLLFPDKYVLSEDICLKFYQERVVEDAVKLIQNVLVKQFADESDANQLRTLTMICLEAKIVEYFRVTDIVLDLPKQPLSDAMKKFRVELRVAIKEKLKAKQAYFEGEYPYAAHEILKLFISPEEGLAQGSAHCKRILFPRWMKLTATACGFTRHTSIEKFEASDLMKRMYSPVLANAAQAARARIAEAAKK